MDLVEQARSLSEQLVAPLGRRWVHIQGVAERASELAPAVPLEQREVLVAAAWLHDVGYAPDIAQTGFHPLDGARYLAREGWPHEIVNLVAHHSGARFEAEERGFTDALAVFPFEDGPALDALCAADLTTGPDGSRLTYNQRISEILSRYGESDPVHRTWTKAAPTLAEAVQRTEERLAASA